MVSKVLRSAFRKKRERRPLTPHVYQFHAASLLVSHVEQVYEDGRPAKLIYWLCMGMGLGKTISSLMAFQHLRKHGFIKSVLVIGPLRVATTTWPEEVEKWDRFADLSVSVISGSAREKAYALQPGFDVYTTNPESLPWIRSNTNDFQGLPWDAVIIDESTQYKNVEAGRSQHLRDMLSAKHFPWVVALTGTPVTNSYEDIFGQVLLLDGGRRLGDDIRRFRLVYGKEKFVAKDKAVMQIDDKYGAELLRRIADICTTMSPEQHLDMPDYVHKIIGVTLPQKAAEQYEQLKEMETLDIDGILDDLPVEAEPSLYDDSEEAETGQAVDSGGALYNLLSQFASGRLYLKEERFDPEHWAEVTKILPKVADRAVADIHRAKLDALEDVIEQIEPDRKIMIAYKFQHEREAIMDMLNRKYRRANAAGLKGADAIVSQMAQDEFLRVKDDWVEGPLRFLLMHGASAGHGLNIQSEAASVFVEFSPYENLEWVLQAAARLYRQGGCRGVFTHITLACHGTVEVENILPRQEAKRERLKDFMDNFVDNSI